MAKRGKPKVQVRNVPSRFVKYPHDRKAIEAGCYFDQSKADDVVEFFETYLKHSHGEARGKPFLLLPWEKDALSRLYGWRRADGSRRFREAYWEIPKKNGKSSLAAGMALFGLFEEPGAEVYQGAANRKQAGIIYRECSRMVKASPELSELLTVIPSRNTIIYEDGDASLKTLSADVESEDGANSSWTILDELHRFPMRSRKGSLYDVMKHAGAARRQPMLMCITTAGEDKQSQCYTLHKRSMDIIEGSPDDIYFFPIIYGVKEDTPDESLDNEALWRAVNPSLGTILSIEEFRESFTQAKKVPRDWRNFKRLRLNMWNESVVQWLDVAMWDECDEDNFPDEEFNPVGKHCTVGVDLSSNTDLSAVSFTFVDGDLVRFKTYFFVPRDTVRIRTEVDGQPYQDWVDNDDVMATEGNRTDYDFVFEFINEKVEAGWLIDHIGVDPWNAQQLSTDLDNAGFKVSNVRQMYSTLSGPCKELERRLLGRELRHDGNPVMRWCVKNCSTKMDAEGNIKPSKSLSTERIDGVPATVISLGLAMIAPDPTPGYVVIDTKKKAQ